MPRGGKRPGSGRPPKYPPEVQAEALRLAAETTPEEAADTLGTRGITVTSRQIRNWQDGKHVAGYTPSPTPAAPSGTPAATPTPPPDPLALVRRILSARDPSALAELEAGLSVAAQGEDALRAWLARPLPLHEPVDPLEAAVAALGVAVSHAERLPPQHRSAATVLGKVGDLAARVEKIAAGRPRVETPDEVTARIEARRDEAVQKIMQHTGEARAKLAADRKALVAWASGEMAPRVAEELARRVDDMLGGPLP